MSGQLRKVSLISRAAHPRRLALVATLLPLACGDGSAPGPNAAGMTFVSQTGVGYVLQEANPAPVIQLVDTAGQAVARRGVAVTAQVSWGDVKIMSGGTATTDATGRASFDDITFGALMANSGEFELRYSSPGLAPIFEYPAITCRLGTLAMNGTVSGDLRDGDCLGDGARYRYYDEFDEFPTNRTALRVSMTAPGFAPAVFIRKRHDTEREFVGFAADAPGALSFRMLVPLQTLRFQASSTNPGSFGNFQLGFTSASDHEPGCDAVLFIPPVTTAQALEGGCLDHLGRVADIFPFLLEPGRTLTVTATSSAFAPSVFVWSFEPHAVRASADGQNGSASLTFLNNSGPYVFYVLVTSTTGTAAGNYALDIGVSSGPGGSGAGLRAPARDTHVAIPLSVLQRSRR